MSCLVQEVNLRVVFIFGTLTVDQPRSRALDPCTSFISIGAACALQKEWQ